MEQLIFGYIKPQKDSVICCSEACNCKLCGDGLLADGKQPSYKVTRSILGFSAPKFDLSVKVDIITKFVFNYYWANPDELNYYAQFLIEEFKEQFPNRNDHEAALEQLTNELELLIG